MTVLFFFSMKEQKAEIEEKLDTFYLKKKTKKWKSRIYIVYRENCNWKARGL